MTRLICCLLLCGCGAPSQESATTPPLATQPGTTGSGSVPATTGASSTQTFPIPQGWLEIEAAMGAESASTDAAVAPDGQIYVSWMVGDTIYVTRSGDGGASFGSATVVSDGLAPLLATGRQPYLHVTADTVWVTFTSSDPLGVHLFGASTSDLVFSEQPIDIGQSDFVDYAKLATDSSGMLWLTWLTYRGDEIWPQLAREDAGFATQDAGAPLELPCECCRNDLFFTDNGSGLFVFRNNDGVLRDIWSMRAGPGETDFSANIQVSRTGWDSQVCPMQGPRVAQLDDGTLLTVFTDPTTGPWQLFTSRSTDDGLSWSGDALSLPSAEDQRTPDIAAQGQSVWLTYEDWGRFSLLESPDGGASFSLLEDLDEGATNLAEPQVVADHGVALVVGANPSGQVLLRRLDAP